MPEEINETIKKDRLTIKNLSQVSLWIALVMLLLMSIVLVVYQNSAKNQERAQKQKSLQESKQVKSGISSVPQKAFGPLGAVNISAGQRTEMSAPNPLMSRSMGLARSDTLSNSGASADSKMSMPYNPELVKFNYVYEGEALNLKDDQLSVFRRVKGTNSVFEIVNLASQFGNGIIDWAKFQNAKINNLSLSEDKDFGYNLDINFAESAVNISQNWQRWPHPEQNCKDEKCFQEYRLKIEQILSDEETKTIAKAFVAEKGIALSDYGEPEMQYEWRDIYAQTAVKEDYYLPEETGVVFPLTIKGLEVYEMFGGRSGLMVSVSMRNKKVSSAYNLTSQNYEESKYEAITDSEKILAIVKKGGFQNYGLYGGASEKDAKKIDVKLGSPKVALLKYYNYKEGAFSSEEILVPALVFPVVNFSEIKNNFYQKSLIIPLTKEIFDKEVENQNIIPEPMPYEMPISDGSFREPMAAPLEEGGKAIADSPDATDSRESGNGGAAQRANENAKESDPSPL